MFHDTSTGTTFPQNGQVGTGLAGGWMLVDGARGGKQTLGRAECCAFNAD